MEKIDNDNPITPNISQIDRHPATELWSPFAMSTAELTARTRLNDLLSMRTGLQSTESQLLPYGADSTPTSTLETLAQIPIAAELGAQFIYQDQAYAAAGYLAPMTVESPGR